MRRDTGLRTAWHEDLLGLAARIKAGMSQSLARLILLAATAVLIACSAGAKDDQRITARGVSIEVPRDWDGRIADRGWPLPGAVIVHLASFELPEGSDPDGRRTRNAMGTDDVLVEVAEALRETELPVQPRRIDPNQRLASVGRYFSVDQFFVERGRAFVLHVTFPREALRQGADTGDQRRACDAGDQTTREAASTGAGSGTRERVGASAPASDAAAGPQPMPARPGSLPAPDSVPRPPSSRIPRLAERPPAHAGGAAPACPRRVVAISLRSAPSEAELQRTQYRLRGAVGAGQWARLAAPPLA